MNFELFLIESLAVLSPLWEEAIKELPHILEDFPTYEDFALEVWVNMDEQFA